MNAARPVIGVLCCNEWLDRPVQVVATRFVRPLSALAGASVLLVPALPDTGDAGALAHLLDGLLLTGSRSHVAPARYGAPAGDGPMDEARDEVALALAGRMIEAGKPVFGICRGLQEINVLFGGTLSAERCFGRHHLPAAPGQRFEDLFAHEHDVDLAAGGRLADVLGTRRMRVNSVHQQAIDRLGTGLSIEAVASDDGLVEAVSAQPCGGQILGVQWHPEWDVAVNPASRAFFTLVGASLRGEAPQERRYL